MTSRGNAHRTISTGLLRTRGFFRPSRGLQARVRRVASLTSIERDEMWALLHSAYAGSSRAAFDSDLSEKHHVIVMKDARGGVKGFSTLLNLEVDGARVLFSGDTIVSPDFWGQTALQRAFLWYVIAQRHARPTVPLYWFLITKGYRTYLLISRYFPNHWPRHDAPVPEKEFAVLDALCRRKFGEVWDPQAGLLRYAGSEAMRLTEALADVPKRMADDADVQFFLKKNPRWAEGDELCCLARADDEFIEKTTRIFL